MKVATEVPTPVPVTWTLTLNDDEMALLVRSLHEGMNNASKSARLVHEELMLAPLSDGTRRRLMQRASDLLVGS